jgi:phosphohistidine phosphatase
MARGLQHPGTQFNLILSSPTLRATQTASILAETPRLNKGQVISSEHLSPAGDPERLIDDINRKFPVRSNIALVGHGRSLSGLISLLVSGDSTLRFNLKKGGMCQLSVDQLLCGRCATLEWLLSPVQLVEIGA